MQHSPVIYYSGYQAPLSNQNPISPSWSQGFSPLCFSDLPILPASRPASASLQGGLLCKDFKVEQKAPAIVTSSSFQPPGSG